MTIHDLVRKNKIEELRAYLSKQNESDIKNEINMLDNYGSAPLHYAANIANPKMIKLLLKYGASITIKNALGITPIRLAANINFFLNIKTFAETQQTDEKDTAAYGAALETVAKANKFELVELLLKADASLGWHREEEGLTFYAMHWAIKHKNYRMMQLLFAYKWPLTHHELHYAVKCDDYKAVRLLLANGADITEGYDMKDIKGQKDKVPPMRYGAREGRWHALEAFPDARITDEADKANYNNALVWAIKSTQAKLAKKLLDANARFTASVFKDAEVYYAEHWAVENNDSEIVKYLLEKGGNFNRKEEKVSCTPFELAIAKNYWDLVVLILADPSHKSDESESLYPSTNPLCSLIDKQPELFTKSDSLILHWAAEHNHLDVVRSLLKQKVDITKKKGNDTAIVIAALKGHWEIVMAIAQVHKTDAKDAANYAFAILKAAEAEQYNVVECLLNAGAPLTAMEKSNGFRALHWAIERNNVSMVRLLLDRGADAYDLLPLAAQHNNVELINLLIERGADPKLPNKANDTAIVVAAKKNNWDVVKVLVEASPDDIDSFSSAFFYAAKEGQLEMMKFLRAKGAGISNYGVATGENALHFAAKRGDLEAVAFLLQNGADHTKKTKPENKTPAEVAADKEHWPVVKAILDAKPTNDADDAHYAPVFLSASQKNQADVVESLIKAKAPLTSLTVDGFCVGDWVFHTENPNLELVKRQLEATAHPELETNKFFGKISHLGLPPLIKKDNDEAITYLLKAIHAGSQEAFHYLETKLAAPSADNYEPTQAALVEIYLEKKDYAKVAEWAFLSDKLSADAKELFENPDIRSHLPEPRRIRLAVLNYTEDSEMMQQLSDTDMACALLKNRHLWNYVKPGHLFDIFENDAFRNALSTQERAQVLTHFALFYPKMQKVRSNNYVAEVMKDLAEQGPALLTELTKAYFLIALLNQDEIPGHIAERVTLMSKEELDVRLNYFSTAYNTDSPNFNFARDAITLYQQIWSQQKAQVSPGQMQFDLKDFKTASPVYALIEKTDWPNKKEIAKALRKSAEKKLYATAEALPDWKQRADLYRKADKETVISAHRNLSLLGGKTRTARRVEKKAQEAERIVAKGISN